MSRDKLEIRIQRLENSLKTSEATEPPTYEVMQRLLIEDGPLSQRVCAALEDPDPRALENLIQRDDEVANRLLELFAKERDEK